MKEIRKDFLWLEYNLALCQIEKAVIDVLSLNDSWEEVWRYLDTVQTSLKDDIWAETWGS